MKMRFNRRAIRLGNSVEAILRWRYVPLLKTAHVSSVPPKIRGSVKLSQLRSNEMLCRSPEYKS